MTLPFIENTDDWLRCPTPLETCQQQRILQVRLIFNTVSAIFPPFDFN